MDFALWSRAAVMQLIERECGIALQVRSAGKYLARWSLTPQSPSGAPMSSPLLRCRPGWKPSTTDRPIGDWVGKHPWRRGWRRLTTSSTWIPRWAIPDAAKDIVPADELAARSVLA